jgi:hypothetical protein
VLALPQLSKLFLMLDSGKHILTLADGLKDGLNISQLLRDMELFKPVTNLLSLKSEQKSNLKIFPKLVRLSML